MVKSSLNNIRKKIAKTHELISTSHHESSHTIYALLHLMKVNSVSIFEDKKLKRIHGATYYNSIKELDKVEDKELLTTLLRADIGMSYAGLAGEKILYQQTSGSLQTPLFISNGSYEDNKSARSLIKKYDLAPAGQKRANFKQKLIREVRKELHTHWKEVVLVSHALFQRRRLTDVDLFLILTKKTDNKQFWKEQFKQIQFLHTDDNLSEIDIKHYLTRIP